MPRLGGLASRYYNILITLSLLLPAPANPAKQHWPFDAVQRRASVAALRMLRGVHAMNTSRRFPNWHFQPGSPLCPEAG
jgi:hypothetical protein